MVNVCGHSLCESCVELLFVKGEAKWKCKIWFSNQEAILIGISLIFLGSGSCPECDVPLRRNNFRVQMFENPMVEKEVDIRRRILRDYNKKVNEYHIFSSFQP